MHKVLSLIIILLLASCSQITDQVSVHSLNGKWNKKDEQKFNFNIEDAQHPKNIIFVVRNNSEYPYSNLRLIVNFSDPQMKTKTTDTLNYVMAQPNGEWLGKGFGDTKEIFFQYRTQYKFKQNGKYSIGILQAMRKDNLPGIEDIGIKIETAKP